MIENFNKYIDHTLLKANATKNDIVKLCEQAKKYDFCSVCVNPNFVHFCKDMLKNTDVKVCTVIGFPLGQNTAETKVFEAENALENGADEIDVVINVANLIAGDVEAVQSELANIRAVSVGRIMKVIIETCYLDENQIKLATEICENVGVDFVKTSTGFGLRGASLEDVQIIKVNIKGKTQIKASGGIKSYDFAEKLINAGATRLGTSSGVALMKEYLGEE